MALALIMTATVVLTAPAAYHRIVYDCRTAAEIHSVGSRLLLLATVLLGLAADVFIVVIKITEPPNWHWPWQPPRPIC